MDSLLTSEETRAALETAGFLSTMACFMYRSMACIMVVYRGGGGGMDGWIPVVADRREQKVNVVTQE